MLIECHECKAKVDAEVLAHHTTNYHFPDKRTFFLQCPSCKNPLIAESHEDIGEGFESIWSIPIRVYPRPKRTLVDIPPIVKTSIEEAERCMQAAAYLAATAMCGRSLEAICRHYKTKDNYLGGGLKELKDNGIIDQKLYQWGEELRDQRNHAAHATDIEISAEDANDVLTFTYVIIDYVFLYTQKFENYQSRKKNKPKTKKLIRSTKLNTSLQSDSF